jgi:hypothetical protein
MTMVIGARDQAQDGEPCLSLMADTMISRFDRVRDDLFPGLLKIITVAEGLSVAFAGDPDQARDRILAARHDYLRSLDLKRFVRDLGRSSRDERCDFLVAATIGQLGLVKLRQGQTFRGGSLYALGDASPSLKAPDIDDRYGAPGLAPAAKRHIAFIDLFNDEGTRLAASVGGFATVLDCRRGAHNFMDHASSISWNQVGNDMDAHWSMSRHSGLSNYTVSCISSRWPNAPVVGLFLPQMKGGWIYDPLSEPDPIKVSTVDADDLLAEIDRRSLEALDSFPKGRPTEPAPSLTLALTGGQAHIINGPPDDFTTTNLSFRAPRQHLSS